MFFEYYNTESTSKPGTCNLNRGEAEFAEGKPEINSPVAQLVRALH
jgi:hypothetical protein